MLLTYNCDIGAVQTCYQTFVFQILQAMQLCLDASSKLGEIMRDCLKQSASASDE